jgi:hypothetical protein
MKKISFILSVACAAMIFNACSKSSSSVPDPVYPKGIHAKINGDTWTAQYANKVTSSGGGMNSFEFDGTDSATHQTIYLLVTAFSGRGAHNLTSLSIDKAYYKVDTGTAAPVYATSGSINITAMNDTAWGGTFNFVAGSKTITDGTFNVNF